MNVGDKAFLVPVGSCKITEHTILAKVQNGYLLDNSPLGGSPNSYWMRHVVFATWEEAKNRAVENYKQAIEARYNAIQTAHERLMELHESGLKVGLTVDIAEIL